VIISSNTINHLIFVMVECGVLYEVRTEILYIFRTSFGFKVLIMCTTTILILLQYIEFEFEFIYIP
jgi:hypothetical protein